MATGQSSPPADGGGPERYLGSGYINCSKDPKHCQFYLFKDFKLEYLPEPYRNEDVFNWIQVNGDLTVKIRAFRVSPNRPDRFTESSEYPMAEYKGRQQPRFGTGYVTHADFYDQEEVNETHGDVKGQNPSPAANRGGYVMIVTSTHVVYDEEETRGMKIDFFDDGRQQTIDGRQQPIELHVNEQPSDIPISHFLGDWCELKCHTDNCDLLSKLIDLRKRLDEAEARTGRNFGNHSPAIVVSHPHGRIKHVTMGRLLQIEQTITMSDLVFYADGFFIFSTNSKITFEDGCELSLPSNQAFTLPTGCKISLPGNCAYVLTALTSFSIRPLQELRLRHNQPFSTLPNTDYEFASDARFSCRPEDGPVESDSTFEFEAPKGTVFHFDEEFPLQQGRHYPHMSNLKGSLAVREYSVAKRVRFDAPVCPGSSGAKVLFFTEGKTIGFAHSEGHGEEGLSGSGCIYKI